MTASCHCKKIIFNTPETEDVINCHCSDCQKLHGNYMPFVILNWKDLEFTSNESLSWYTHSEKSKRGFCSNCGSRLFMRVNNSNRVLVAAGSFDDTSHLKPRKNVFIDSKGGYYFEPQTINKNE